MGMTRGARGSVDRVDRAERGNFGLGRKTRRKSFLAVTNGGGDGDGRWLPEIEREEVIMIGDAPAIASASTEGPIPLKTAKQKLARKNELKA
ncbi:hypothetical protein Tco_0097403 [Tanacetum coccineum]